MPDNPRRGGGFAIGQENSVLNLGDRQVKFYGERIQITEEL